ncbi:hypothetical protein [Streptococcus sp. 20-1249]|uniref:hypothetical protein n=1 Tax=Streptococcus hepaticus TaxID=3349163 RepID=UPI003747D2DA
MNDFLSNLMSITSNETILQTETLTIKNNTLITKDNSLQIHNISMIERGNFKNPITMRDIIILMIICSTVLIPPFTLVAIILLALYSFILYQRYQKHLSKKFFIIFNLGSSRNYMLFFADKDFRDDVFNIITNSFSGNKTSIYIDIKNQKIDNLFEKEVTNNNINGDNNIIGNSFGSDNTVAFNGNVTSGQNVVQDSTLNNSSMQNIDLPWKELNQELSQLIDNNLLSEKLISQLKKLLESSQNQDAEQFKSIIQKNEPIFNSTFFRDMVSGTFSAIIAGILLPK